MAGQPSRSSADPLQQWPGIDKLNSVQDLLDQNKLLIAQINENHELKTADALNRNTALINTLNSNVAKVVGTYSLLASQVEGDQQQLMQPPQQQQQQQQQQQMQAPQLHHHHHHHHH